MPFLPGDFNDNILVGTSEADGIAGFGGNDVITGGRGGDAMEGGAGRDIFRYTSVSDSTPTQLDNLYDFVSGEDTILLDFSGIFNMSMFRLNDGSSLIFGTTLGGGVGGVETFAISAVGRAINGYDIAAGSAAGLNSSPQYFGTLYFYGSDNADGLITNPIWGTVVTGGGGADTIIFNRNEQTFYNPTFDTARYVNVFDSTVAAPDTIHGFTSGEDKIDLRLIRTGSADTVGFAYLDGSSFVFVDIGGNGTNDMLIQLSNVLIKMSDIIWPAPQPGTAPVEVVYGSKDHYDATGDHSFGFDQLTGNPEQSHDWYM